MQAVPGLAHALVRACVICSSSDPTTARLPRILRPIGSIVWPWRVLELGGERDVNGKCEKHDPDDAGGVLQAALPVSW